MHDKMRQNQRDIKYWISNQKSEMSLKYIGLNFIEYSDLCILKSHQMYVKVDRYQIGHSNKNKYELMGLNH